LGKGEGGAWERDALGKGEGGTWTVNAAGSHAALPISIFRLSALDEWKKAPSSRPVTVKTPPITAQIWVKNVESD